MRFITIWKFARFVSGQCLIAGKTPQPEKTFAWYWLENGEESEYFDRTDGVFECFHNFVAFNQRGRTLCNMMASLRNLGHSR